jgi:hypothetical protein
MQIDWSQFNRGPDIGESFRNGMENGRTTARQYMQDSALAALAQDPNNARALRDLASVSPEVAAKLEDRSRERNARQARSSYMIAGMTPAPAAPHQNALSAFAQGQAEPVPSVPVVTPRRTPVAPTRPGRDRTTPSPQQPQLSPKDQALMRFIQADPEGAADMRQEEVKENFQRLRNLEQLNNMGMQLVAGVNDQASYERALQQAKSLYDRFGEETLSLDQLPRQWTPEVSEQLRMQGMDTQKQLASVVQQTRLKWDITDDEIDNERADRNADSLINYREERLADYDAAEAGRDRRHRTPRPSNRAAPAAKGPSPTTVIGRIMDKQASGQALTSAEQRTYDEYRAGRGRSRGRGAGSGPVAVGPNGEQLVVRNGKWVDAKTGKSVG